MDRIEDHLLIRLFVYKYLLKVFVWNIYLQKVYLVYFVKVYIDFYF